MGGLIAAGFARRLPQRRPAASSTRSSASLGEMARNYRQVDLKILFARSGNRCAYPTCNNRIVAAGTAFDEAAVIGQIAHIVGSSDLGPRSDPDMSPTDRDRHPNLVLLCGHHHPLADKQDSTYTVEEMREWKLSHELWVDGELQVNATDVTFTELDEITAALLVAATPEQLDLSLVPVREKMEKNALSEHSALAITTGLLNAENVRSFIEEQAMVDSTFPDRLKAGFVDAYNRLRGEGAAGDELFDQLSQFAAQGDADFRKQAAGLAVLAHLFEACEVFEH